MTILCSKIANQIEFLLQHLNEANTDSVLEELRQLTEYGIEGSIQLLQACLGYLVFHRTEWKNTQLEPVLISTFKFVLEKPNFATAFCESLGSAEISQDFLENLGNIFRLSLPEKISLGLSFFDSENLETRMSVKKFCIAQIQDLFSNPANLNSTEQLKDVTPFVLTPWLSEELREANFFRNLDLLHQGEENELDEILAEMEDETSMGDTVEELGFRCTADASHCKDIFSVFPLLNEVNIAKILGAITCNDTGLKEHQSVTSTFGLALGRSTLTDLPSLSYWDADILINTIKQLAPGTNWIRVVEHLDHEGFYIPDGEAFSFFMSLYRHACQDPFPLHAICGSLWKNTEGQVSFLKYAVMAPPEVFSFAHSERQLAYSDAVRGHELQVGEANHAWLCLDLLDVLCQLAERGHVSSVRSMLEYPLKHCPEILLLGLSHVNTASNLVQYEVCLTVFPLIQTSASHSSRIQYLWHVNPYLVVWGFVGSHSLEPDSIAKIFEICQDLKILPAVLDLMPTAFAIRLAALASRKQLIDLEKWLSDNVVTYKDLFFEDCLEFLKEIQYGVSKDFSAKPFHYARAVTNLYIDSSSSFLKVLKDHSGLITSRQLLEEMERLQISGVDSNLGLKNGVSGNSPSTDGYPEDVEAEANSYLHQMFSGQLSIDAVVQMLVQFKESSVKREQYISECMIGNLFEQCMFFSMYPERELRIAAVLFGSLIKHQLVTHLTLGIALGEVLDALRKPPDSKMFVFGTNALEQFVDRLIEWPQYCNHILQISHLRNSHSELVAFIERALARISSCHIEVELNSIDFRQSAEQLSRAIHYQQRDESDPDDRDKASVNSLNDEPLPSSVGQFSVLSGDPSSSVQPQNTVTNPTMGSSSPTFVCPFHGVAPNSTGCCFPLNTKTLKAAAEGRETPIEAPAPELQGKILFLIDNISTENFEAQAKEFIEILREQFYPWFAQYMVVERVSIEPKSHDLYLKFLDKVDSKALNEEIIEATYKNCIVLLKSELIKYNSEERSLLKNLGSWLGWLTIGKNKALLYRQIDPKTLIMEAYERGLMIAVIPFIAKILEPCRSSRAYQPPNAWTMAIMELLAEIYSMPNLKANLKYAIEVLFMTLDVDMKTTTPTSLLKDRKREIEGNPDFSNKDIEVSQPQILSSPIHISSTPTEEERLAALSDQLPSEQEFFQAIQSQSPYPVGQMSASSSSSDKGRSSGRQRLQEEIYLIRCELQAMNRSLGMLKQLVISLIVIVFGVIVGRLL